MTTTETAIPTLAMAEAALAEERAELAECERVARQADELVTYERERVVRMGGKATAASIHSAKVRLAAATEEVELCRVRIRNAERVVAAALAVEERRRWAEARADQALAVEDRRARSHRAREIVAACFELEDSEVWSLAAGRALIEAARTVYGTLWGPAAGHHD